MDHTGSHRREGGGWRWEIEQPAPSHEAAALTRDQEAILALTAEVEVRRKAAVQNGEERAALRERIEKLEKIIEDAPHGRTQLNAVSRTCSVNRDRPCDCWKALAAQKGETR